MKKAISIALILFVSLLAACSSPYQGYQESLNQGIYQPQEDNEEYQSIVENPFIATADMPVSTFSTDVDTAAYAIIRRKLTAGTMPNKNAVRIEEMINYFTYNLPGPDEGEGIRITTEYSVAPWNEDHNLLMIGLKTKAIEYETSAPSNLVFLLDVSGSMNTSDKLPLLKSAIRLLINQLRPMDRISIVVYAGAAGVILDGARRYGKSGDS
ncbi:MAG: von Willebrand factor type A domain-containing protein [Bacillus subtilis]|nr:von Willebrand factor type A domain-containing protein [Bacillus subtilis]